MAVLLQSRSFPLSCPWSRLGGIFHIAVRRCQKPGRSIPSIHHATPATATPCTKQPKMSGLTAGLYYGCIRDFQLECQSVFWSVRVCSGVSECVLECQSVFWSVRVCSAVPECVLQCQSVFWSVRVCSGVSECVLECQSVFWSARVCSGCS
jgi:hypothetical protein